MNHEHGQGDDPEIPGKVRPASDANDQEAADDAQAVEPADGVGEGTTERIRPEARVAGADGGPGVQAANAPDAKSAPANKNSRRPWQKWGTKLWAGGVAAVVTGAVSAWLAGWFSFWPGLPLQLPRPPRRLATRATCRAAKMSRLWHLVNASMRHQTFTISRAADALAGCPCISGQQRNHHSSRMAGHANIMSRTQLPVDPSVLSHHLDAGQTKWRIQLSGTRVTGSS